MRTLRTLLRAALLSNKRVVSHKQTLCLIEQAFRVPPLLCSTPILRPRLPPLGFYLVSSQYRAVDYVPRRSVGVFIGRTNYPWCRKTPIPNSKLYSECAVIADPSGRHATFFRQSDSDQKQFGGRPDVDVQVSNRPLHVSKFSFFHGWGSSGRFIVSFSNPNYDDVNDDFASPKLFAICICVMSSQGEINDRRRFCSVTRSQVCGRFPM